MNNYYALPTTTEEEEAMNAITQASAEVLHNAQPQPNFEQILKTISEQFALLSTVINQSKAQPDGNQSLQECVGAVLEQAGWVGDRIDKSVGEYIENDVDWSDVVHNPVSNAVEYYFDHGFSLNDHCDLDDIVADKLDDMLENIVNERLQEMLSTATITFNN
jgi:hypothetical protein